MVDGPIMVAGHAKFTIRAIPVPSERFIAITNNAGFPGKPGPSIKVETSGRSVPVDPIEAGSIESRAASAAPLTNSGK